MRCVNLDWLEVSCEESPERYPCNADYFRDKGYWVSERDYGTRVFGQVFVIEDSDGHPWIEVRREPPSGGSSFTGLNQYSCRLRLVNAQCYVTDCVERLRSFMLLHGYVFKRIFRIDIAYDFEYFDSGDRPDRFARLYIERKFRKVNQSKLHAFAADTWTSFDWESLSWGSPSSMVSTKLYNKSKEIAQVSKEKGYIKLAWMMSGLIDNPITCEKVNSEGISHIAEIWRVEFSLKSKAERWLVIEDVSGKRMKKKAIPHTLDLFDSPDKLWQRFQDLAYHYFRFKVDKKKKVRDGVSALALDSVATSGEWVSVRKDLCPDKRLFRFDKDREFLHIDNCTPARRNDADGDVLERRLLFYRNSHNDERVKQACTVILECIENERLRKMTPKQLFSEVEALRRTLALRMRYNDVKILETIAEIQQSLFNDEVF